MQALADRLKNYKVEGLTTRPVASGKLVRVVGLTLEATGCRAPIGSLCLVETMSGHMEAEVVGFSGDNLYLMPSEQITGICPVQSDATYQRSRFACRYGIAWPRY